MISVIVASIVSELVRASAFRCRERAPELRDPESSFDINSAHRSEIKQQLIGSRRLARPYLGRTYMRRPLSRCFFLDVACAAKMTWRLLLLGRRCLSSPVAACGAPKAQGLMNVSYPGDHSIMLRPALRSPHRPHAPATIRRSPITHARASAPAGTPARSIPATDRLATQQTKHDFTLPPSAPAGGRTLEVALCLTRAIELPTFEVAGMNI
jgi:hypothetical protein